MNKSGQMTIIPIFIDDRGGTSPKDVKWITGISGLIAGALTSMLILFGHPNISSFEIFVFLAFALMAIFLLSFAIHESFKSTKYVLARLLFTLAGFFIGFFLINWLLG